MSGTTIRSHRQDAIDSNMRGGRTMSARKPTIWEALATRLGREPMHAEACAEVRRILSEGAAGLRINGTSDVIGTK